MMSPLEKIRTFSQIAVSDANLVIESSAPGGGDEVTLERLYVTRLVEGDILGKINRVLKPEFVLVIGEAGYGKTSLLWNIYRTLGNEQAVERWFIKSSLLRRGTSELSNQEKLSGLSPADILRAVKETRRQGLRPVLMFDTLDLLLHSEEDRLAFLTLARELIIGNQCLLFASCRPQEASLLRPLNPIRIYLNHYDDKTVLPTGGTELSQAVDRHAALFCAGFDRTDLANQLQVINDAVACGKPLRAVCVNPLPLRMLFDIYRPAPLSPEINIFKLYNDYWQARVITDYRPGMPEKLTATADLSSGAMAAALTMLAEGKPEIAVEVLEKGVVRLSTAGDASWWNLIGRNVLQKSELGTIGFFHQTFFEHAAARGLLKYLREDALSLLERRLGIYPHDLFLSPVYEQALLLAGSETINIRRQADEKLLNLLRTETLPAKLAGLYVYSHRPSVPPEVTRAVIENLQSGDPVLVDRYLEVISNVPAKRLAETFAEFDAIWSREPTGEEGEEKWREQEHLLEVLPSFAARDPHGVKEFLIRNRVLKVVLSKPPTFSGDRKLLGLFAMLADFDSAWSLSALAELFVESIPRAKNRDLQTAVLREIYRRRAVFGEKDIATRFSLMIAGCELDHARNFEPLAEAFGRLWSSEWRAQGKAFDSILREVAGAPDGFGLRSRIKGLVFTLAAGDEKLLDEAWGRYLKITEQFRQWLWVNQIWADLLGRSTREFETEDVGAEKREIAESVRVWLPNKIKSGVRLQLHAGGGESPAVFLQLIHEAGISSQLVKELLDSDWLTNPEAWLDSAVLKKLLPKAFAAGHEGAVGAVKLLLKRPKDYRQTILSVNAGLVKQLKDFPEIFKTLLDLCLEIDDGSSLNQALKQMSEKPLPPEFFERSAELERLREKMTESRSSSIRNAGVQLWEKLARMGIVALPSFEVIKEKIENESVSEIRGQLITLMGTIAPKHYAAETTFEFLLPWAESENEGIRRVGLQSLVKTAVEINRDFPLYAARSFTAALKSPTDAERIALLKPLIEKLIPDSIETAVHLMIKAAMEAETAGLGINARRTVFSRFQRTIRSLVRAAPIEQIDKLLESVPRLDRHFGALFVEAICVESYTAVREKLEKLLDDRRVRRDVQKIIVKFKNSQERISGNEGWAELYALIDEKKNLKFGGVPVVVREQRKMEVGVVGIIFALKEEFKEFFSHLGEVQTAKDEETGRRFYEFSFPLDESSERAKFRCVATFVGAMGETAAAIATENLLRRYQPKTVVVIGLAGALEKDLKIGDIVIPSSVDGYLENAKAIKGVKEDEFEFRLSGESYRTSVDWLRDIDNIEFENRASYDRWQQLCAHRMEEILVSEKDKRQLEKLLKKGLLSREASLMTNVPIASGPIVSGAEAFVKWLLSRNRKYAAVEMETQGVLAAIHDRIKIYPNLVLRCISDYGDERKKELDKIDGGALRRYALHNAVDLLWMLLENRAV